MSPLIPNSVQKELNAMEVEFTKVTNADNLILEDMGAQVIAQDSSIIHIGPSSTPGSDLTIVDARDSSPLHSATVGAHTSSIHTNPTF